MTNEIDVYARPARGGVLRCTPKDRARCRVSTLQSIHPTVTIWLG